MKEFIKKEIDGLEVLLVFVLIILLALTGVFDIIWNYGYNLLKDFKPIVDEYDL